MIDDKNTNSSLIFKMVWKGRQLFFSRNKCLFFRTMDSDLAWGINCSQILKKAKQQMYFLGLQHFYKQKIHEKKKQLPLKVSRKCTATTVS